MKFFDGPSSLMTSQTDDVIVRVIRFFERVYEQNFFLWSHRSIGLGTTLLMIPKLVYAEVTTALQASQLYTGEKSLLGSRRCSLCNATAAIQKSSRRMYSLHLNRPSTVPPVSARHYKESTLSYWYPEEEPGHILERLRLKGYCAHLNVKVLKKL